MATRKLFFPNGRGERLAAYLEEPEGRAVSYALLAHCFTCSKDYKALFHIGRVLAEAGLGVLRFDFTGLGESEGDFAQTDFSSTVEDLLAAERYLAATGGRVEALFGHSLGGVAALAAGPRIPSCGAVVTLCAPFEPGGGTFLDEARGRAAREGEAEVSVGGRTFRLKKGFFDDLARVRPGDLARELGRPLLVFQAAEDELVDPEDGVRLLQAARFPKSFVSVSGADHLLSRRGDALFVGELAATWLTRELGYLHRK